MPLRCGIWTLQSEFMLEIKVSNLLITNTGVDMFWVRVLKGWVWMNDAYHALSVSLNAI